MKTIRILLSCWLTGAILIFGIQPALAFCGFYVAKADSSLYNQASQVIIARDGNRTVLTMSNDYQGEVKDFAMVVPVPVVLKEEQVHVNEAKIMQRLDGFSAPRLVEYFDEDPCNSVSTEDLETRQRLASLSPSGIAKKEAADLGVTVEEQFSVGEYDIVILSAQESDGLSTWLVQNDYKIPQGAKELLQPYIRQNLKFFVAKVNLKEFDSSGFEKLRPISIAFESPKFMLPIRLGMINASGDQDLIVYLLSPKGQVELTNYRTAKIPSNKEVPEFVKDEFKIFYTAMFQKLYEEKNRQVAFLEYAWDMSTCDPCSAEPLNQEELKQAGVFWLDRQNYSNRWGGNTLGNSSMRETKTALPRNGLSGNVFVTRLHIRYTRDRFPEDLKFQTTGDRTNFQGRYIIRHPFTGNLTCDAGKQYRELVEHRQETEIDNLAQLTRWSTKEIRDRLEIPKTEPQPWWNELWN